MKVFLTLQAALIAVTLLLCLHARGLSEDVGITRMDTIEKIHNSNCDYIAVIHDTEELYDRFSQLTVRMQTTALGFTEQPYL